MPNSPGRDELLLPPRSDRLFRLFRWYAGRYVARHFRAVRVARDGGMPELPRQPVVVVLNHPSWWDPLVGLIASGLMPAWRRHYAPIEAIGLDQYRFLGRIGFFGFDARGVAGPRRFLRTSLAVMARPESALWITAQGRFVDPRERPVAVRAGIGYLAHRLDDASILPMAVEYPFWDDRCPEVLVRFGRPLVVEKGRGRSGREWSALVERGLEETVDRLAADALARDPARFSTLIQGTSGVGGIYDMSRRVRAWLGGRAFRPEHATRQAEDAEAARNLPREASKS